MDSTKAGSGQLAEAGEVRDGETRKVDLAKDSTEGRGGVKPVLAHSAAPGYYWVMISPSQKPLLTTNRYLKDPELRALLTQRSVADSCLVEGIQVEKPEHPAHPKPRSNPSD